jgi:two-component system heavy metal sensor histidine kinase CusS
MTSDTRAPGLSSQRSRSLAQRLALWLGLFTAASLLVFAIVAYVTVIAVEHSEMDHDSNEEITSEARKEVGYAMLVATPLCLAMTVVGTMFLTRRGLRPLNRVIHAAALITPRALEQRLPVPQIEDEVRDVVLAFNALLARLEHGFLALDRFALDASHELRTPLAVMSAELEVMLRGPRPSVEWETTASTCLDEVRRLTHLVEALLDMGRAERTQGVVAGAVDVQALVERVIASSRKRAEGRGVYLGVAPGVTAAGSLVLGEAPALQSALSGVVDNAIQYTPSGGEVLVWLTDDERGRLTVHVDDSGPGVSPEDEARIFEPFTRGKVGRESSPGFGLGLSIARRICERNGGTIRVSRSPRGGARFSLSFPASAVDQ